VLFVADPGTLSNSPEAEHYVANLKYANKLPAGSSFCPAIYVGKMMRQDVAVVLTGWSTHHFVLCRHCSIQCKQQVSHAGVSWPVFVTSLYVVLLFTLMGSLLGKGLLPLNPLLTGDNSTGPAQVHPTCQ
jgi:hypothetical protein